MQIKNPIKENDFFPELTPLIDVMFLLLVFFMLTTTFERDDAHKTIVAELPQAQQSKKISRESTTVLTVKENGEYILGDTPCAKDALPDVLKIRMEMTRDSVVVISAHKDAPYHSIIYIYDVLQALGIEHFAHEVK
jgi:biopolymer transport protein ExbD